MAKWDEGRPIREGDRLSQSVPVLVHHEGGQEQPLALGPDVPTEIDQLLIQP